MTKDKSTKTAGVLENTGLEIAVIGMAGRFPGAGNIHEFWENLINGVETISYFSDRELEEIGMDPGMLKNPNYVKSNGVLGGVEYFDSIFFGYSPREANLMDPQQRIFHECAWSALEDAGYYPEAYEGFIGLYAGASNSFGWEARAQLSGEADAFGQYGAFQLTNKDFLTVRISYKLNLKGPAVVVQSACSTSLLAIHIACQAILNGECDMALAGGVSVSLLKKFGYLYHEGLISSPDGHCRTFDARAKGTIIGNGAAVVVLKRLEEAINCGDFIYAVVKGSAVNNDGVRKIGFTAPSIEGQAEVIMSAQEMAEVDPESITYIETHGTGTELGDPVEIEALKLAFEPPEGSPPVKKNFCALGSLKSNMGHLDAAAGAAGFIKTVLALYHRKIPPSLHFEKPNPKLEIENSPFYVNPGPAEWEKGEYPRRAGVSSFGIGGTNSHVILEEAPVNWRGEPSPGKSREYQLIVLSAKTRPALEKITENLANYLSRNHTDPVPNLADIAYTLQVGRGVFKYRQMLISQTINEVHEMMSSKEPGKRHSHFRENDEQAPSVILMFPGQGAQYVDMGLELYRKEPVFREEIDRCFDILKSLSDEDIKEILYPAHSRPAAGSGKIDQTEFTQPVIFIFEYALAKLLMKWGIEPYGMIGHSIGEYVAACLSGVFSLEDALKAVVLRGKMMQRMLAGAMLSVNLPEKELVPLLESHEQVSLAAVNSSALCTVSGDHASIGDFEEELKKRGYESRRLHTSHAFHSASMDPILKIFEEQIGQMKLNKPEIPYISNVTGNWIKVSEAVDPAYWATHLRQTVRFAHGLNELLKREDVVFVEVGPGNVLSTFVRKHECKGPQHFIVNLVKHPKENLSDQPFLLNQIGKLWLYGAPINWQEFHAGAKRFRIPLPTYPFEEKRYPVGSTVPGKVSKNLLQPSRTNRKKDMADWFFVPQWIRSTLAPGAEKKAEESPWLIFMDDRGLGNRLVKSLEPERELILVRRGETFSKLNDREYTLSPGQLDHYGALFQELQSTGGMPGKMIHLWNITGTPEGALTEAVLEEARELGFYSLLWLAQAIGKLNTGGTFHLEVVTDNMQEVTCGEGRCPHKAVVLGPVRVIPREYPNIRCRSIDIRFPDPGGSPEEREQGELQLVEQLLCEFNSDSLDSVIALRGNYRWLQTFESVKLEKSGPQLLPLEKKGVYLVTGGLGGIGLTLAGHLVKTLQARVILTGRSPFPASNEWQQWLDSHDEADNTSRKIRQLRELQGFDGEILIFNADVSDKDRMQEVINQAFRRFGRINGVIHSAGVPDGGVIQQRTRENSDPALASKVKGTVALDALLQEQPPDVFVMCSSLSSYLGPFGQVAYCSANSFLDAYAHYRNKKSGPLFLSINWDAWKEVGMAVDALKKLEKDPRTSLKDDMSPQEGVEVFERILGSRLPQVAVSVKDFSSRPTHEAGAESASSSVGSKEPGEGTPVQERPDLSTEYVEPEDEIELTLAEIFKNFLGIERVGIDDNFFELGLSSLDLVQINAKLKEDLNKEIPVVTMFTHSSVRALAQYVTGGEDDSGAAVDGNEDRNKNEQGNLLEDAMNLLDVNG